MWDILRIWLDCRDSNMLWWWWWLRCSRYNKGWKSWVRNFHLYEILCGHHLDQDTKHCQHPKQLPYHASQSPEHPPDPATHLITTTVNHYSNTTEFLSCFWTLYKWNDAECTLCVWLLLLIIISVMLSTLQLVPLAYSFLLLCSMPSYEYSKLYVSNLFWW